MRDIAGYGFRLSLLVMFALGIAASTQAQTAIADQPKPIINEDATQAMERIHREIHVGMTDDEAKRVARSVGATMIAKVDFISEPPGTTVVDLPHLPPTIYGLAISIDEPSSNGLAGHIPGSRGSGLAIRH